jgi:hypothetical protein
VRELSVGADRVWLGSQAFHKASTFNADIGVWNTARVTTLDNVCAAFDRRHAMRQMRSGGARCGAAIVRGGTADARTRACE